MKKLSLFLSALFISVMSFAADATFVFNTEAGLTALGIELPVTDAGNGAFQTALDDAAVYTMDGVGVGMSVTHKADGSESGKTRIWKKANGALDLRTYKDGGSLTFTAPEGGTISKIVLDGGKINFTVDGVALTDNTWAGEAASVTLVVTATCNVNTITVTYEAAAEEKPEVTVPTNAELLLTFKQDYLAHFNITDATDTDLNVREAGNFIYVMNSKGGDAVKFITENANWKWLADYIISVAAAIPEGTNEGYYWRANLDAFFHCKNAVAVGGVNSADFTEAGKPENWGPYYLAAQKPSEPEVTTVTLTFDLTSDAVLDRMGRRYVMAEDATLGTVNLILPTFNTETASYTDASLVVGDSTYAATATFAADTANNKEVYTAVATSTDTIFNVTMTVTYPTVQEYTFFAMDDAEATVEDWGEEGEPFMVYMVAGAGMLDEEPVEFELMIDQLNNLEGMIGEAFVMGTATSLYEEEGNLAVSGTAMDDAGNTYNIELWVPLAGGEVEIVITEEVDVTLYNLNLDVQGNMVMVTAGGETGVSFFLTNTTANPASWYGMYFSDQISNIWYGDAQLQAYGDAVYTPDSLTVAFITVPDAEGKAVQYNFTLLPGDEPTAAEPALKGVVKRAVQLGESVVVLTHEADGTAHIYNVVGEKISEVSQEGVIAVDTANAGDLLAISDIAVTEDGKLVAINYMQTQSGDDYVDAGYKRGETRVYLWDNLAGDPSTLFTSKMSSNWFRSKQGLTMAVKGTSDNMEIFTTGIHATSAWARVSSYRVIDGVYTEPDVNNNDNYHFYDVADAVALETTVGTQYELNASPLGAMNWILDAELINPVEIVEPETNNVEISTCVALTQDLGKKFNGATILKEGEQVLMVAPYADADGKLAGVKVLDITNGLAADSVVATLDLDAPVEAAAAATAVEVAAYDVNITLVADGYIYNLVYNLPKPERTETTVLNPFAYDLSSTLSEDLATLTINYTLNANADAVEVVILSGEEVVKTIPCKGINKGTYTVEVSTAGLPQDVDFTWSVNVKGTSVAAPTQNPTIYSFYHPSGLDIDNNPENPTFGMLLINEGMHSVKDIDSGYVSSNFGAGIFAFNPALEPMPNGDKPGYNGGVEFTTGRADGAGTAYSPRRIRISEDGRIFVTSLNTDGTYLWEVNPANMNEWTPVFQGTLNENKELVDADSNFVAAPNNGFDVKGAGENLQLMMYSVNLPGITGAAMSGFRCDEYNLGTATTWATAPSKNWVLGKYAINYTGTQVVYDNEGGIWIASYRGTANDANPGLVHINADGVEDAKLVWSNVRQAGIRFNNDFTKLIVAGNNGAAKKATIYAVSKDENGAPVLTEETVIDMAAIGNNINDLAFDYAGNLYACGNSAEKLIGWAMPYSGEVATPAASKYAFTLESEPEYPVMEDNITNLIYNAEEQSLSGGPSTQYGLEVFLVLGQDNLDGTFALDLEQSSIALNDNDLTILSGYVKDIDLSDLSAPAATAVIVAQLSEFETYEFHLTMTSAPAEVTVISITDAAVVVDEWKDFPEAPTSNYALTMTADWTNEADGLTYPVKVEVLIYDPNVAEQPDAICNVVVGDLINNPFLGGVDGCYLTITTVEGVVTAKGVVTTSNNIALDLTISGKLPTTALDNIQVGNETMKVIRDGQLIIIKNDVEYNIQGATLK